MNCDIRIKSRVESAQAKVESSQQAGRMCAFFVFFFYPRYPNISFLGLRLISFLFKSIADVELG